MLNTYQFFANQKTIKLQPKDDREVKKDRFKKIKEKKLVSK